ncbi:MAG: hypothetical protein K6E76_05520 [Patescibacteria group bacterium]|nr:hypothetical protein [Patescibacteria group bacterium]
MAYQNFLQQNNQYLHKGKQTKTELNLNKNELYYTGDIGEYAEHPEIKFKNWEETLQYGISEIERFHHLSGVFYQFPSRTVLTSMNDSIP